MATYLYGSQEMMHMMNPSDVTAAVATTAFLGTEWNLPSNYHGGIVYQDNQHNLHQSILRNRNHLVGVPMTFGRPYHDDMGAAATSVVVGSKYLKAAQQLLEEVVDIGKGVKEEEPRATKPIVGSGGYAAEIDAGDLHDVQMKKTKLAHLLDEVEQRYRQYDKQMQVVIASFESVAGVGSARAYTALALRTISKQFRCLRDAIADQIRARGRVLGEEEECQKGSRGGSRLRYVDHHLRQQRTLQQLQHNAWRPQRGLPERSVSVLRSWLFEHFLHPYPKDSDKLMLAKQTGLTRNQVSNWFINARVRLWKPMVEEMYVEEMKKERATDTNSRNKVDGDDDSPSKSNGGGYDNDSSKEEDIIQHPNFKKIKYNNPPGMTPIQPESKQPELFMGYGNHVYNLNLLTPLAYSVGELDRMSANSVALTLGLSGDGHVASDQFNSASDPVIIHSQSIYGNFGIESRKDFAAQLLPDFVA